MTSDGEPELELYVVVDGALVQTSQTCTATQESLTCHDGELQTLQAYNVGWITFPLPDGALVDAVPRGYCVMDGQQAAPADAVAAQYASGPVSTEELVAIATEATSPWPVGVRGFGWEYVFALAAVLAVAGGITVWAVRRRRASRAG